MLFPGFDIVAVGVKPQLRASGDSVGVDLGPRWRQLAPVLAIRQELEQDSKRVLGRSGKDGVGGMGEVGCWPGFGRGS